MKKLLFLMLITLSGLQAQEKTATRYYQKGDYLNAIVYYEKYLDRNTSTKVITQNLADSYYRTFKFKEAKKHLLKLLNGKFTDSNKEVANAINFKLYHVLSALGEYEKGLTYLATYYKNKQVNFDIQDAKREINSFRFKSECFTFNKILSTDDSEFGAVRIKDSLYFVSNRKSEFFGKSYKWTHKPFSNIFKAKLVNDRVLESSITALPKEINSKLHEGNFCFTKDGKTLYFSRSNITKKKTLFDDNRVNPVQIFKSINKDGVWLAPEKLPFCKNTFSYQHPALDKDETKLYLSSNEGKENEDFDIFYVEVKNNNTQFGSLVSLGNVINTMNREHFPFISEDGNLFFASNGHLGLGMLDVFVSRNIKGIFQKPLNLGAPLNSKYDDFSMVYADEKTGYFASNRVSINDDIYRFNQVDDIFVKDLIVNIELRDNETKDLIKAVNIVKDAEDNIEVYNDTTSTFSLNLNPKKYILSAKAPLYNLKTFDFIVTELSNQKHIVFLDKLPENIVSKEKKEEKVAVVNMGKLVEDELTPKIIRKSDGSYYFDMLPINFRFDKWDLTSESKGVLDDLASKMKRHPSVNILVSSHTDSRGSEKYNQILSDKRALSTRNYLVLIGAIDSSRIEFAGFGEINPINTCEGRKCTKEDHRINRRSEFRITKY